MSIKFKLEEEGGITAVSLNNARKLIAILGKPKRVALRRSEDPHFPDYLVDVKWPSGAHFTFSGFSWGYGGEGPHGLATFAEMIGLEKLLPIRVIAAMPTGKPGNTLKLYTLMEKTLGAEPEWIN